MTLKLRDLQAVVDTAVKKRKVVDILKESVLSSTGFIIDTAGSLDYVCYQVNEILDANAARGIDSQPELRTSLLKKLQESRSFEARKLAARLLPTNIATSLVFDINSSVRAAAAWRLPTAVVKEALQRYPNDFELQYIFEKKNKEEKKKMGTAARPMFQAELSDTWYADKARRFLDEYGTNIEYQWEEPLIQRYCSSLKMTSGIDLDVEKFYKILMKLIEEKEELALTDAEIRRMRKLIRDRGISESTERGNNEIAENAEDVLRSIANSHESSVAFLKRANDVLKIKEAVMPAAIRKYNISNGNISVPLKGRIPGGKLTALAEQTFDTYISKWNTLQEQRGEPLKLSWDPDPSDAGGVTFSVVLR